MTLSVCLECVLQTTINNVLASLTINLFLHRITVVDRVTTALFDWSLLTFEQSEYIDTIGLLLVYVNPAINPTLYALSSRFYRQAFKEALGVCRCRRRDTAKSDATSLSYLATENNTSNHVEQ